MEEDEGRFIDCGFRAMLAGSTGFALSSGITHIRTRPEARVYMGLRPGYRRVRGFQILTFFLSRPHLRAWRWVGK